MYFYWITAVAIAFVYNALGIILRSAFDLQDKQKNMIPFWLILDYVCDAIYLVDIIVVQFHLSYSDKGLLVVREMIRHMCIQTYTCTHSLTHSHTHSLTHTLTHSLTHTLTHTLTHSHTHSLTHSLTHTHARMHMRTHI